jgi:hypothetical protein
MGVVLELLHLARQLNAAGEVSVSVNDSFITGTIAGVKALRLRTLALERQCRIGIRRRG